ncbi:hypothetical protein [Sphingomonas sp. PR090111-T3T-6A]|uniref:hypothetical protein n=1 Tax=Sphingomonas sp. PR090111-T3T-6A TaxID=685778 RepID=UPI000378B9BA|nr:hypothetical protein [Sphingomonas sp. PR090111-T3T-6A]
MSPLALLLALLLAPPMAIVLLLVLGRWFDRPRLLAHAWLIAFDQWAYVTLAAPKYLLLGGPPPSQYETISSKTGRMAIKGHRWAIIAEAIIDWLAVRLGGRPDHCRRVIIRVDRIEASLQLAGAISAEAAV